MDIHLTTASIARPIRRGKIRPVTQKSSTAHADQSKALVIIIAPSELFEFLLRPFGLRNPWPKFQQSRNSILQRLDLAFAHLDASSMLPWAQIKIYLIFWAIKLMRQNCHPRKVGAWCFSSLICGIHCQRTGHFPVLEKVKSIVDLPAPSALQQPRHYVQALPLVPIWNRQSAAFEYGHSSW